MADSHPVGVLIVGAGSIGERHLRCFQSLGTSELSFVEVNDSLRSAISNKYGVPGFKELDAALGGSSKVAVVATPAHLHVPMATRLAEAGIHVLIEKPLSTGLAGIDRLQCVVRENNLVAAVAYVYRCFPSLAGMRDAITSGRFGKPVQIVAVGGQHFPTYRPAYRETYYASKSTGGGIVQDALTHILNACEWLVGPIQSVAADAAHQILDGVDVDDTAHVIARHGSVLGCYSLNQHQAPNELTITVACQQGTARWQSHEAGWRWMTCPGDTWHCEPFDEQPRDAAFIEQARRFLGAVAGKWPPPCSLDEGLQTLRVNLTVSASAESHTWQSVTA